MNPWLFKSSTSLQGHVAEHRLPGQGKCSEHRHLRPLKAAMGTELTKFSDGSCGGTWNAWSDMAGSKEPATVLPRGLSRDKQQQHPTSLSSSKLCICRESLNANEP